MTAFWGITASAAATLLFLFLWTEYPAGKAIYGANAIFYTCVLSYWVKNRKKKRFEAKAVEPDRAG